MCACLCTCLLVACALLVAAFVFRYVVVRGKQCTSQARLGGKTVIVTGEFPRLWTPKTNKQKLFLETLASRTVTILFKLEPFNRKRPPTV